MDTPEQVVIAAKWDAIRAALDEQGKHSQAVIYLRQCERSAPNKHVRALILAVRKAEGAKSELLRKYVLSLREDLSAYHARLAKEAKRSQYVA
jgi:hypothetical protein